MRFTITHTQAESPFKTVLDVVLFGDVLEGAKAISRAFPGERVQVFAMSRERFTVKDGVVVRSFDDVNHWYDFVESPPQHRAQVEHEWANLIPSDENPSQ